MARGFNKLKGITIAKVNAKAINEVRITSEDGTVYRLEAETGPLGIPVISLYVDTAKSKVGAKLNKPKPWKKYSLEDDKTLD